MSETKVTGVALKPHSESVGKSGIEKHWPEEELQSAVHSLNGCPVYEQSGYSAPDVIGSVVQASYYEDLGVVYEVIIENKEIAKELKSGKLELAPKAVHDTVGSDTNEPVVVSDLEFKALFVTSKATDNVPGSLMVDGVLQP